MANPFRRLGEALARFWQKVEPPEPPALTPNPPRPPRAPEPIPGVPIGDSPDTDYTDQQVIDHIVDLVGRFPQFKIRTVRRNVSKMEPMDRWVIMHMDGERFRALAARNPLFWYH